MAAVIHTTHGLHQDLHLGPGGTGRERKGISGAELLQQTPGLALVQDAQKRPVPVHICPVSQAFQRQGPSLIVPRQAGPVIYEAKILAVMLHGLRQGTPVDSTQDLQVLPQLCPLHQGHLTQLLQLGPGGQRRQGNALMPAQKLPNGKVLRGIVPVLIERRVIIIAGHRGIIADVLIGAGGKPEVGTAVKHVQAEAGVLLQKERQLPEHLFAVPGVVLLAPVVKPAAPELCAHLWPPAGHLLQRLKGLVCAAAKVDCGKHPLHRAAAQHAGGRSIGGKEGHLHATGPDQVPEPAQICLVVAIAAILILHLHRQEIPTPAGLQRQKLWQ